MIYKALTVAAVACLWSCSVLLAIGKRRLDWLEETVLERRFGAFEVAALSLLIGSASAGIGLMIGVCVVKTIWR